MRNAVVFLCKMHLPQIYLKRYHEIRCLFPQIDSFLLNFFLDNKEFLNNTHYTSPNKQLNCADWCYIENIVFRFYFGTARSTKKTFNFSNHSTTIGFWLSCDCCSSNECVEREKPCSRILFSYEIARLNVCMKRRRMDDMLFVYMWLYVLFSSPFVSWK